MHHHEGSLMVTLQSKRGNLGIDLRNSAPGLRHGSRLDFGLILAQCGGREASQESLDGFLGRFPAAGKPDRFEPDELIGANADSVDNPARQCRGMHWPIAPRWAEERGRLREIELCAQV